MLVDLTISRWRARTTDRKTAAEVAQKHKADSRMLDNKKLLIAREGLEDVRSWGGKAREAHKWYTLPWNDEGMRILSSAGYFQYMQKMHEVRKGFDEAVDRFIVNYATLKKDAEKLLGELFDEADYPKNEDDLRRRFGLYVRVLPLPSAADFRVKLGDAEVKTVRAEIEANLKDTMKQAMQEPMQRAYEVVQKMVERLTEYKVSTDPKTGKQKVENTFRDSLITNISDLMDVFPLLNVTGDPNMDALSKSIKEALLRHTPEVLRDDEKARKATVKEAEKILKKLGDFI